MQISNQKSRRWEKAERKGVRKARGENTGGRDNTHSHTPTPIRTPTPTKHKHAERECYTRVGFEVKGQA